MRAVTTNTRRPISKWAEERNDPRTDKVKAKSVLIIGDEELKSGTLVLRDMATKEQRNVREEDLV